MKVKELIEELKELDPELELICQGDAEGNSYRKLAGVDDDAYAEDLNSYDIDVSSKEWLEDEETGEDIDDYTQVVVLYPC